MVMVREEEKIVDSGRKDIYLLSQASLAVLLRQYCVAAVVESYLKAVGKCVCVVDEQCLESSCGLPRCRYGESTRYVVVSLAGKLRTMADACLWQV